MINCWFLMKAWIVLTIQIEESFTRPQGINFGGFGGSASKRQISLENGNKTRTRILTNPPRKSFFGSEQDIIFPDELAEFDDAISSIDYDPKCADGLPFCEKVETYPYDHLKEVLTRNQIYKDLFGEDEVPQIANRVGEEDEKFVCRSTQQTIFPQMGINKNNKWKFIINQGDNDGFVQGVRVELCRNPENECDIPADMPQGYQTFCRQKFVYRRLLSVDPKGTPIPDTFKVPSACCCAYRQDLNFLSRFGREFSRAPNKEGEK